MSDRFISPCPLPSPYEAEILTILIEEAAEIQQRATKLLRFGRDEIQPGQPLTNMQRMSGEIGDFMAVLRLAEKAGLIDQSGVEAQRQRKHEKLRKYMQTEPST